MTFGMTPQLNKDLNGFNRKDNTLSRAVKDYAPDRIELEIGDSKEPGQFMPQAKVMRWDNEVNLSVRRQKPQAVGKALSRAPVADVQGDHVTYDDDDETVHIYERPEVGEDGGLEIELHLKHKPDTNRFDFSIQTKGLNFYYQPALTEEEIEEGVERPDNVVGSYAVYHATNRDNRIGGKEYKTGKFCHIYRPHITDADGNETWGELELDEQSGLLTVVVPQAFLGKAVYPVVVDPTFGYTSVGASNVGTSWYVCSGKFSPEFNGTVSTFHTYTSNNSSNTYTLDNAIYLDDGSIIPSVLLAESSQVTIPGSAGAAWFETNISLEIFSSWGYWLCRWSNSFNVIYYYDDTTDNQYNKNDTYPNWPDPITTGGNSHQRTPSVYATYTASGEPPTVTTQAVSSIGETTATGSGNVTDDDGNTITERGFVYGTSSLPGTKKTIVQEGHNSVDQTSLSSSWTHSHNNPVAGNLIIITVHDRNGLTIGSGLTSISYGGVTPELVLEDADWPSVRIYVIKEENQPTPGVSHDLSVGWSGKSTGTTSVTKLSGAENNVAKFIKSSNFVTATSVSTSGVTAEDNSFVIDAVTAREGGSGLNANAGQTKNFYSEFSSPRGAGSSYKILATAGSTNIGWSGGSSSNRIRHLVVTIPPAVKEPLDFENSINETGTYSTGTYSLGLTGLTADTTYYVRAYATNSEGTSYGSEVSFTTNVAAPTSPLSIKVGGTFQTVTPKIKVGGTFVEKTVKIKQGGTFS